MRIIAGEKRGTVLSAPKGMDTRPTLDRVKESLFGILQFQLAGKRVLDLFAGSGGLGLEALSRGAEFAAFCDSSRESSRAVQDNIRKLGYENRSRLYCCDWTKALSVMSERSEEFDIVFLDPPYASGFGEKATRALFEGPLLRPGFIIAIEHDGKIPLNDIKGLEKYDERRYGEASIALLRENAK